MFTNRLFNLFVIAALVLVTACTPQVQATSTSTALPQPAAASTVAPFEGLSSGLDNATQARIRTVSMVMGVPTTDVYVDGMPAMNGGVAQAKIGAGQFSGWLYVAPGTYSIALVPHGGTLDQALFASTDVKVDAGHRYTVAAMGQLEDKDVHPLVVDETALEADPDASASNTMIIDINNLIGADSITEECDGKAAAENIQYGEARAYLCASGTPLFATLINNSGKSEKPFEGTFQAEPGTSFALPWFGPYPASNYDSVGNTSQGTSELNVIDFLAGFSEPDVVSDGYPLKFNTLLAAIDKAGMRDQLTNGNPYMLLAPTDGALALLPQAKRDALLNDPQALANLLNGYIVDGYFPAGSFLGSLSYGTPDRTVTNRLGQQLIFHDIRINGKVIEGPNYTVGNGYRIQVIISLLPEESAAIKKETSQILIYEVSDYFQYELIL